MEALYNLLKSLRPRQWIKNGFVLIPLVFAKEIFDASSVLKGFTAAAIFCLLSGAMYLINDMVDLEADRQHPVKRNRPLASGGISTRLGTWASAILLLTSLAWGFFLSKPFLAVLVVYVMVQIAYNCWLKHVVILDIFCVSAGFFLRVTAGGAALNVTISNWLIICTISIAIFLTLGKRRGELALLRRKNAITQRKVFTEYDPYLLDQMIGIVTATTLLSYMLYCISPQTIAKFQTEHLIYTFPFVLYGIFRYLYLIHRKDQGSSPDEVLTTDLPLLLSVILWGTFCILIIYGLI